MTDKGICPHCEGSGWVTVEKDGLTTAKRCRCFFAEKAALLRNQANIPKRYRDCSFDNFKPLNTSHHHAVKIAKRFIDNYPIQDIGLLFQGSCGVGKTHLAVAIINELIRKKSAPCYFYDFRDLIRSIQSSYSADNALTETEVLSPVFDKNVLVLDELGAKKTSPWVEETVFYIINHRYNNQKLTIFTSNYMDQGEEEEDTRDDFYKKQDDTLVDRIGIRLRSRIYEMCKLVSMEGKDFRKEVKQAGYRF